MNGFFNRDSYKITKPYYKKYIEEVKNMAGVTDTEFAVNFLKEFYPSFAITEEFLNELRVTIQPYENNRDKESYYRTAKQLIETLEISKKVKDFAKSSQGTIQESPKQDVKEIKN